MMIEILTLLSAFNLLMVFLCQYRILNSIKQLKQMIENVAASPDAAMLKVEDDLNNRLRMLQTSKFGPNLQNPNIRLIRKPGEK